MKISCEQCGAAYAVRDEKVAGRKLKLRCKRCGEPIAVDASALGVDEDVETPDVAPAIAPLGTLPPPAPAFPSPPTQAEPDPDLDAVWHLAIDDRTQGPYTAGELAAMLSDGSAGAELLCWREGLSDWQPLGEIAEIVGEQITPVPQSLPPPPSSAPAFSVQQLRDTAADPFADAQEPVRLAAPDEAAAAASPDPRRSAAQILSSQSAGTVQFSMDEIRALSSASSPPPATTRPSLAPGHASGESSGLIDMRALANMADAPELDEAEDEDDSLLRVPVGVKLDSLAPIQLAPRDGEAALRDERFRTRVLAGVAAFGFVLAAAVAIVALTYEPEVPAQVAAATITAPVPAPAPAEVAAPTPSEPAPAKAAAEDDAPPQEASDESATNDEATAEPDEEQVEADEEAAAHAKPAAHRASTRQARKKKREPRAKPRAKKGGDDLDDIMKKPAKSSGDSTIDDLLLNAVRNGGKKSKASDDAPAKKAADLPKTPSRGDMLSALSGVKRKVQSDCKGSGVATAAITIKNTGRVSGVRVSGVSGSSKSCVERAVKGARFPKFSQPSFQVKFPFKLAG